MHFVSYYYDKDETKSTYYKDCYHRLKGQLDQYSYKQSVDNINFDKQGLDSRYHRLNMIKPEFLLQKMEQLNDAVVWIDADCIVNHRLTELENADCDIGFFIRHHDNRTPHAAIIYFNNTEKSKQFLLKWKEICDIKKNDPTYDCTEHCILVDLFNVIDPTIKLEKYYNIAASGDYNLGLHPQLKKFKVWVGISPEAYEYEKNKVEYENKK